MTWVSTEDNGWHSCVLPELDEGEAGDLWRCPECGAILQVLRAWGGHRGWDKVFDPLGKYHDGLFGDEE
ncbi:hypothetical protein ACFYU5_18800 [Nocardia aobensis]|uniref:Uncharacterized protein n=1 Tax=Nocardia aobensis TaxID=257277 RepID=A0ABW6P5N6_9NOCA